MFDAIDGQSAEIIAGRASGDPEVRKRFAGRRPTGITTKRRNLAALRSALAEAASSAPGRPRLIAVNVAAGIKFGRQGGKRKTVRSKARLWTAGREAAWRKSYAERTDGHDGPGRYLAWRNTAARPSNVMIWKPGHLGRFLDSVTGDRLYAMFCVIAYCELRRGEACGLRWEDVDFDTGAVMIGPTIVQVGWKAIEKEDAKADASETGCGWRPSWRGRSGNGADGRLPSGRRGRTPATCSRARTGRLTIRRRSRAGSSGCPTRRACRRSGCMICGTARRGAARPGGGQVDEGGVGDATALIGGDHVGDLRVGAAGAEGGSVGGGGVDGAQE
jgi:integrase